jgi:hypothetical protein
MLIGRDVIVFAFWTSLKVLEQIRVNTRNILSGGLPYPDSSSSVGATSICEVTMSKIALPKHPRNNIPAGLVINSSFPFLLRQKQSSLSPSP